MQIIGTPQIIFLREQDGESERIFKKEIRLMLAEYKKAIRAYLVQVAYDSMMNLNKPNVMLCFRILGKNDQNLIEAAVKTFKGQFSQENKLDIMFLSQEREIAVRAACCPFFTSEGFQYTTPDFYLVSEDSPSVLSEITACFKRKKLYGQNPNGYMLCDINPAIIGQKFGLGGKDINQVVLFTRFIGDSLFNIKSWPLYVHVARPLCDNIEDIDYLDKSKIQSMIWGEIYKEPPTN